MEASRSKASDKKKVRASGTDPEARIMLQANGAYGPAYNIQISTDAQSKIIVGMGGDASSRGRGGIGTGGGSSGGQRGPEA
jgi:hypothetical protein